MVKRSERAAAIAIVVVTEVRPEEELVCSPATWFPARKRGSLVVGRSRRREGEMKRPRRSEGIYDVVSARCRKGQGKWEKERIAEDEGVGWAHLSNIGFPFLHRLLRRP